MNHAIRVAGIPKAPKPSKICQSSARLNRHSPHPEHSACEMDEGEEVDGFAVEPGGEAAEVLELVEQRSMRLRAL